MCVLSHSKRGFSRFEYPAFTNGRIFFTFLRPEPRHLNIMLQEGFTVLVIGMTTVLCFLVLLVALICLMGRFVAWFVPPSQPTTIFPVSSDEESLVVAIATARRARG